MKHFEELNDIYRLEKMNLPMVHFETLGVVKYKDYEYPIKSLVIGSKDRSRPTFGLFGGVHGLERIGSQVIIAFFNSLFYQLKWDKDLVKNFEKYRIVSIPIVNPGGMARHSRSNPNDVDIMRNAPIEADDDVLPLVSGHRLSRHLPWYRGPKKGKMELEAKILTDFVEKEMFESSVSIPLDVHSGFGVKDQLWYPYAKTKKDFPRIIEALNLKKLLDETYPHHIYKVESQSENYITHGDLWDYLFDKHYENYDQNTSLFMPLTLELGSWNWVKKNPGQFFNKLGLFHPIKDHRHARTMRRHLLLLDFLTRAVRNHKSWIPHISEARKTKKKATKRASAKQG